MTKTPYISFNDLRQAAVDWICDASHAIEEEDAIDLFYSMSYTDFKRYIDRHFSGGFDAFVEALQD